MPWEHDGVQLLPPGGECGLPRTGPQGMVPVACGGWGGSNALVCTRTNTRAVVGSDETASAQAEGRCGWILRQGRTAEPWRGLGAAGAYRSLPSAFPALFLPVRSMWGVSKGVTPRPTHEVRRAAPGKRIAEWQRATDPGTPAPAFDTAGDGAR